VFPIVELTKPLLLLDVDGVLIPYAAQEHPVHFRSYTLLDEPVWLAPCHGDWLQPLCDLFHILWATGWEHDANRLIAPILRLPAFPVIEFPRDGAGRFSKFPVIAQSIPDHPLVWIDDELPVDAHRWAAQRRIATLLIDVDPARGLTEEMVAACKQFAVDACGPDTEHI
jgi:HAD domain in Swiss Army Knife RNA repair proteins